MTDTIGTLIVVQLLGSWPLVSCSCYPKFTSTPVWIPAAFTVL